MYLYDQHVSVPAPRRRELLLCFAYLVALESIVGNRPRRVLYYSDHSRGIHFALEGSDVAAPKSTLSNMEYGKRLSLTA